MGWSGCGVAAAPSPSAPLFSSSWTSERSSQRWPASCFLLPARSPPLLCPGVEDDGVREQALVHVHALPALLMWNASAAR